MRVWKRKIGRMERFINIEVYCRVKKEEGVIYDVDGIVSL